MEDSQIVQLYWDRNEQALSESSLKYGAYLTSVSKNILSNAEDAEECVNDTWLRAWNSMPPARPSFLSTFLAKITRNLSFDRWRALNRKKRGSGEIDLVLSELKDCVSGQDDPEKTLEMKELTSEINRFLSLLSDEKRLIFILRYWYVMGVSEIASRTGRSENSTSVTLSRIRFKLKDYLKERGFDI